MMRYFNLNLVRNKPRPVRKRFSNGVRKTYGLLWGKKHLTGTTISNGVKIIGLVWLVGVGSVLFSPVQTYARLIRDVSIPGSGYLEKAVSWVDGNPRYERLGLIWEERVDKDVKLEKISSMINILNVLGDSASSRLWKELSDEEKNIFCAAGAVLRINPEQLLYEYINQINFYFLLNYIYQLSHSSIQDISSELSLFFTQDNQLTLRERTLTLAKSFWRRGFTLEGLLSSIISLASRNSQGEVVQFEKNLEGLYTMILDFDVASIDSQPILSQLLYHTKEGHLELTPYLFRETYLNMIGKFVLSIKEIYSVDLMETSLDTAFYFSLRDASEFYNNLRSLEEFIIELGKEFPFSLDSFKDVLLEIKRITKDFPLRSNISPAIIVCESLNEVKLDPNKNLSGLVKTALNISFDDEKTFRSHMKIIQFFLDELVAWGSELEYYLKEWIPKFAEKIKEFVDVGKLERENVWRVFRYNFILSLKDFLSYLKDSNIYSQEVAGDIIEKNLTLIETTGDFLNNTRAITFLVKELTLNYPSSSAFLSYLVDKSFSLSYGSAETYQLNNRVLEFLIKKINLAEISPSQILKQLIDAAELTAKGDPKVYQGNLAVIQQFIKDLTPYKERLQKEGIILKEILQKEIPQMAQEAKGNYFKFRQELRDLKERLVGP